MKPFFYHDVTAAVQQAGLSDVSEPQRVSLYATQRLLDGDLVLGAVKPLERYSILPGRMFASSPSAKQKFKILRLVADDVVYEDQQTRRVETQQIDRLLKEWSQKGLKEISLADSVVETVKEILGPVLGSFLTAALIRWLIEKLGK